MASNNSTVPSDPAVETPAPPSTPSAPSSEPPSSPPTSEQSSSPPPAPSSQPSSSPPPSTPSPTPSSSPPTPSSTPPSSTIVIPSTTEITVGPSNDPSTVLSIVTITSIAIPSANDPTSLPPVTSDVPPTSTSAPPLQDDGNSNGGGGLDARSTTAIAVVVPVVAVALLAVAGLFLWRRRKQRKSAEEDRRKEMEEYGFNPNNDPSLPAIGGSTLAEDESGYRGWGTTTATSNRKTSTAPFSDSGSQPGGYSNGAGSPHHSDGQSMDPLMENRRHETMDSETLAALGAAPAASQNRNGVQRGPSNASSSYSAGRGSDNSGEGNGNGYENYTDNGYYQTGLNPDAYGAPQPIIRDVSARRNTKIENPSVLPQQGNSGIAQNF